MKMWQLFSIMAVVYLAPNLSREARVFAAAVCLVAATIFGFFHL